jgi:hypothetical protein
VRAGAARAAVVPDTPSAARTSCRLTASPPVVFTKVSASSSTPTANRFVRSFKPSATESTSPSAAHFVPSALHYFLPSFGAALLQSFTFCNPAILPSCNFQ